MASPEERQKMIKETRDLLAEISAIDSSSLSRTEDLSKDINFSEAVPYFEQMIDLIKQLNQRDISRLSSSQLTGITNTSKQLKGHIKKVRDFTLNQNTPADVCKSIIDQVKNAYDAIMEPLTLPLAFTATQATDYAKIEREAKGYHSTMQEEAGNFSKLLEKYKTEAEKALQAVKSQAAEAGVASNAQIFLADSDKHYKSSKNWLIATIASTSITFLAAAFFVILSFKYTPSSTAEAIQYVVSKLILLSTLSFAIYWCSRNYRSSKHNETLNKHRANALMTFKAFVEGSNDNQVKDAILLHAAQAAFVNRPTGYESHEKDTQSINPVVEVLGKSVAKSAVHSES